MDVHIGTRNAPLFVSLGFSFLLSFIVLVVLNSSLSLSLSICASAMRLNWARDRSGLRWLLSDKMHLPLVCKRAALGFVPTKLRQILQGLHQPRPAQAWTTTCYY